MFCLEHIPKAERAEQKKISFTFENYRQTSALKTQTQEGKKMRLPGVEPGSIAWKAIILTVGLQTLLFVMFNLAI